MPGIQNKKLFILAANKVHRGFRLRQGADVVFFPCDVQERTSDMREVYLFPTQVNLALDQFVLLIKLTNPLLESGTCEWDTIIHPFVHRQPGVHRFVMHDAVPHGDIGANIVGDRLYQAVTRINKFSWDVAKGFYQDIRVKVFLTRPKPIESHALWCEINGAGQQNQVFEGFGWEKSSVHGAHCATHAKSEQCEFLGMGMAKHLLDSAVDVVQNIVLKCKVVILITWGTPIEHIHIEAVAHQVLHQAIAWNQVQNVVAIDECV